MSTPQSVAERRRLESFRSIATERLTRLNLGWIQIEQGQADPGMSAALLRDLHTLKGEAGLLGFSAMANLCHRLEDILRTVLPDGAIDTATGDLILRGFDLLAAALSSEDPAAADVDGIQAFLGANKLLSPPAAAASASPIRPADPPDKGKATASRIPDRTAPGASQTSVRVTAARLDRMREIVGELMLTRARLDLSAQEFRRTRQIALAFHDQVSAHSHELGRTFDRLLQAIYGIDLRLREDRYRVTNLIAELDGVVRELRLVPLETLLRTYPLAVHALARELGREIRIEFDGEAVEVDRSMLERLADPLLHLVRNAVDHGIEPPDVRVRAGKARVGTITLHARLNGQKLEVEVSDDGAGIDVEAVRARAIELGFHDAATAKTLSEDQVLRTLFQPGMSTRREVTQISGRGIGLDVVLRSIEDLGGSVTVRTVLGQKTTLSLSVPVASALASMVLFDVETGRYALPAASVAEIVDTASYEAVDGLDGPAIRYGGVLVPLISLVALLGETPRGSGPAGSEAPTVQRLLVVRSGRGLVALSGSSHHAQREVVQKAAGKLFSHTRLITGAIPLEDGSLSLVLSPSELLPDAAAQRPRAQHAATAKVEHTTSSRTVRTVLVVDDSPVVRDLLAEALRAHGVRVLEAGDGEEALARLDASPEITLIVSDVDMPKLDGIGLVQRVRSRGGPQRIPIVIVSMRASTEDQRRAVEAGADAYMVKTDLTHSGLWALLARFIG